MTVPYCEIKSAYIFFPLSRENGADSILDLGLLDSSDKVQVTELLHELKLLKIQLYQLILKT